MTISVTQEDIDHGVPFCSKKCPVALALQRKYPRSFVSVSNKAFTVGKKTRVLSPTAARFVSSFDRYTKVRPFQFTIPWE